MHYKPKSVAALQVALGGLPDRMRVHVDPEIPVTARTVGELRKVTNWPANAAIARPQGYGPDATLLVSRVAIATRVSPKT
jgi:hypothetical protein